MVRQIIACIWTFHLRVYTLYPKPACFMHCVGGKCILKYHASFESFSSENAKSLFGPSVPSHPAVCTYSVVAPRLACDFRHFPRVDFSHLRGSLGATDDRLLSRCKLTFGFHNNNGRGATNNFKTPSFSQQCYVCMSILVWMHKGSLDSNYSTKLNVVLNQV